MWSIGFPICLHVTKKCAFGFVFPFHLPEVIQISKRVLESGQLDSSHLLSSSETCFSKLFLHVFFSFNFQCHVSKHVQALRLQLGNLHVSQLHSDAPEPSTCRSYHTARSARSGTSGRSERSKQSLKKDRDDTEMTVCHDIEMTETPATGPWCCGS